ncbi:MAG: hypothetical protein RL153_714 [Verrucomicrobiota bacterium]
MPFLNPSIRRLFAWAAVLPSLAAAAVAADPARLDFNRDVRPILAEHCLNCHGFDDRTRKGGLRLDRAEDAWKGGKSGRPAIVPGKAAESELVKRLRTTDPDDRMPPEEKGVPLTDAQRATLERWVAEGGEYRPHWAFLRPEPQPVPAVKKEGWARSPLDAFVLARMEREGLEPRPEADRTTLARRLSLDLTGLPPKPEEIDAFVADTAPNAYERLVDRLLASARYGERMAVDWLDAARYADTHGYHIDSARDMTSWRDGVIRAFNDNQRYDQFTVEQIAGDLLPEATEAQKVASGFNRNHMINYEGGAIPEEYHTAYIVDRINTTSTVWLGLTVACAQCHDHKYDPITTRDYYGMYAIFNGVPENGLDGRNGNAVPVVRLPKAEQAAESERLAALVRTAEARLASPPPEVREAQREWEQSLSKAGAAWNVARLAKAESSAGARMEEQKDGSWFVPLPAAPREDYVLTLPPVDAPITGVRIEALPDDRLPSKGPGRFDNGNIVLGEVVATSGGRTLSWKSASASHSQDGYPVAKAIDGDLATGWAILPRAGKASSAVFALSEPVMAGTAPLVVTLRFSPAFDRHSLGRFRVSVTSEANPQDAADVPEAIRAIARVEPSARTAEQGKDITRHYQEQVSPVMRRLREEVAAAKKARDDHERAIPTSMVMAEMAKPRDTFVLVRGQYDKKGEKVGRTLLSALPGLPGGGEADRLALARWLVSPEQPLTARVTVNRFWQMLFGNGLVKSAENFGTQGDLPSHPELLDWLALELVRTGWDVKGFLKMVVTSATYRQDSRAPRTLYERDPENRLLARGPRIRLQAEFLRDLALSASGLLDDRIGGPPVFPYQPAGLWEELMSREDNDAFTAQKYVPSKGRDLYRRTMYTFIKRTSPHPSLSNFDAPDRQVCSVRRPRTNTPLQALALMNDPTYVEAARHLAARMVGSGETAEARIASGFRRVLGRLPTARETAVLARLHQDQREVFLKDAEAARRLLSVGDSPATAGDAADMAAWAVVAGAILNLDEAVTKG